MNGSLRPATRTRRRAPSGLCFDADPLIHGGPNALLAAEVWLRRLDGNVSEQELDRLQFAARRVAQPRRVVVSGNDARGVLFGVGRLLRESRMERQSFTIADGLKITEDRSVSCLRVIRPESADVSRLGLGLPGSNLGRQLLAAERWFLSTMG